MADDTTKQCPTCNGAIIQKTATCRSCGLNVHTGESFEMQRRKARDAKDPQRPLTSRMGLLLLIAFGFVILAGFMYQTRMVDVIREDPDQYREYVEKLERVDALFADGQLREARGVAKELLEVLRNARDSAGEGEKARTSLLGNFIAKAELRMEQMPEHGPGGR